MQTNFNPIEDTINIRQFITKPKKLDQLIKIIAHRSNNQRQEILKEYLNKYQTDLLEDFKKELSGNFLETVISLFYTPVDFDCYQLNKAMKGLGTNEDTLIEILASRDNERIIEIKKRYIEIYKKTLNKDIQSETSGPLRKLFLKLLEAKRRNNFPIEQECNENAQRLYDVTSNKKECIQDTFIYIFTDKSREELALIAKIYYKWYSKTLFELVESFFSGDFKRALKAIIYSLLSPSEYFAYRINKAMKGLGTKDTILIRVIVSRDEIDMYRIKRYYKQLYNIEMYEKIKDDTSGDYRNLLLELIGE
jgi:annexin A7/11